MVEALLQNQSKHHLTTQVRPHVHKFGGSSLKDAEQIDWVVKTIKAKVNRGDFVVVSANGQVTNYLLSIIQGSQPALAALTNYLCQLFNDVLLEPTELLLQLNQDLTQLAIKVKQPAVNHHEILALGELWSAQLLSAKLIEQQVPNNWLDARSFLVVDAQNHLADIDHARTQLLFWAKQCGIQVDGPLLHIVTGFIANDLKGESTTLGRNGSDYTATLIADLVQSAVVYLWTDVDGVYTADPRVIPAAKKIEKLTISEAQALSELGSNVLHQKTIAPILRQATNLVINTCVTDANGTVVERVDKLNNLGETVQNKGVVKTLAHKANLVFLSVAQVNELKARQFQAQLTAVQINNYANNYDKTQHVLSFYVEHNDWITTTQLIKSTGLTLEKQGLRSIFVPTPKYSAKPSSHHQSIEPFGTI